MIKKTVIIGGVAGGATAAARLRRRDENMEIVMLERGEYISYANCGLPYYIGGVIKSREALLLQTPEAMKKKFNIDVRILNEVVKINIEKKTVSVRNLKTGEEYEESYDALIIATGSSPLKPPIPGIDGPNIYPVWTIPDTDKIKSFITEKKPGHAVVIGGGFIGVEMAENLNQAGLQVSLIEMQNQVMAPLDYEMAQLIHENMAANGVNLILNDGVSSFEENHGKTRIHLSSNKIIDADLIILSIGIKPNSALARDSGIELNQRGGIVVDEYMRTSAANIYAVGDVAETENFVLKTPTMIPLAGPANKQARICADHVAGYPMPFRGTQGTTVAKIFDLTAAAVGVNEKTLKAMGQEKGKDYRTALISQKSHAGYYPKATPLTMKMIFTLEGKILGAQAIGQDGVDKRIDTVAVTMRLGGTIYDLEELELAYAPPFSSAKDPVNMLGFTAHNICDGLADFISWEELDILIKNNDVSDSYTIVDVTEEMERMVYKIPGSIHIPLGELRSRYGELKQDNLIIFYCSIGVRSYNAARILMQKGFAKVKILAGGTSFYKSMRYQDNISLQESQVDYDKGEENVKSIDCCGLQCPGPIMKVHEAISNMEPKELLKVSATDMGFARDIDVWCKRTGNTLVKTERKEKKRKILSI